MVGRKPFGAKKVDRGKNIGVVFTISVTIKTTKKKKKKEHSLAKEKTCVV